MLSQSVLTELVNHPALQTLTGIAPAVEELSHDWHSHLHFTARVRATTLSVIIKTGVTEGEIYWTEHLAEAAPNLFPQFLMAGYVFAPDSFDRINFLVTERLPYSLIGPLWQGRQKEMLLDAAAYFHQAAQSVAAKHLPHLSLKEVTHWPAEGGTCPPPDDWRSVAAFAEQDYNWLLQECPFVVCHGDLHVGNAFSRTAPPSGDALLIDINPILQPWVFDAAWVEACMWNSQARDGIGYAVRELAERRRVLGLEALPPDVQEKAGRIALSWFAIRNWDPDHLEFMPGFQEATEAFINLGADVPR